MRSRRRLAPAAWRKSFAPAICGSRATSRSPGVIVTAIDATPDRSRFLALMPDEVRVPSLTVVQHWQALVDKR